MILSSETDSKGGKVYSLEMTEKEFKRATESGKTLIKPIEYAGGKGRWEVKYVKKEE